MKIRLKNFRSFRDTGWVELKPLMILAGANSSGKSSFLRFFPLMKQTLMQPSGSPLLWFGNLVDFGSFSEAVSRQADPKEIEVQFGLELEKGELVSLAGAERQPSFGYSGPFEFGLTLTSGNERGSTVLSKLELGILKDKIQLQRTDGHWHIISDRVPHISISPDLYYLGFDPDSASTPFLLPKLFPTYQDQNDPSSSIVRYDQEAPRVVSALQTLYPAHTSEQLRILAHSLVFDSVAGIRGQLVEATGADSQLTMPDRSDDHPALLNLQLQLLLQSIPKIFSLAQRKLEHLARYVLYSGPVRLPPERFYRRQELDVGQIDMYGANLPMFLDSLNTREFAMFAEFTMEHLGHRVVLDRSASHVQIQLVDSQGNKNNLVDMGYGFSQVLPIIAQSWHAMRRYGVMAPARTRSREALPMPMVCIEQPELHLHPELQSYLADMFVAAHKASKDAHAARKQFISLGHPSSDPPISFLIETHSEALLARLGAMVEVGKVSSDDISVLLFEKEEDTGITSVRPATFNARGELENWPIGFFAPSLRD